MIMRVGQPRFLYRISPGSRFTPSDTAPPPYRTSPCSHRTIHVLMLALGVELSL